MSRNDLILEGTKRCLFPSRADESSDLEDLNPKDDDHDDITEDGEHKHYQEIVTSPTSVVNILADLASSKSTTIVMGDEGAEVALYDLTHLPSSSRDQEVATPGNKVKYGEKSAFHTIPGRSLLDVEKTPNRSPPHVQGQLQLTPSTCACFGCDELGHAFVERTITNFLEEPATEASSPFQASCTDWQAWSYVFCSPAYSRAVPVGQSPSRESIRSVLRHRAAQSLRARKTAVHQLSKNLAPFANSPGRSPARSPSLFRNRSFSVSQHRSAIVRVSKDRESFRGSFADVLQLCTMSENDTLESGDVFKMSTNDVSILISDDDGMSYDSDPEEFTRRGRIMGGSLADDLVGTNKSLYREQISPLTSHSPSRAFMDVHNDEVFSRIVQEIFNETTTLVLHSHCVDGCESQAARPVAIDAWLERGQNLANSLIQPKWMWKQKPRKSNGSIRLDNSRLQAVELLDVTRILKMEDIDRKSIHPFAKFSHCFVIKTIHKEEFCFEAPNEMERDRLVYSLKLVIARFGAKVLVGDPQVYCEFFSMVDAGVSGNAPDIYGEVLTNEPNEVNGLWKLETSDLSK